MKFDRNDKIEIFENAISWIVVFAMFIYGGAKIFQFDGASEIDKTVSEMTGMELMWAFYGYSKSYAITLGLFEIIGGALILKKRTRIYWLFVHIYYTCKYDFTGHIFRSACWSSKSSDFIPIINSNNFMVK